MCCEDYQIARRTEAKEYSVPITSAASQLVEPSPERIALIVGPPGAGTAFVTTNGSASATNGFPIRSTDPPLVISILEYGSILPRSWSVLSSEATESLNVVEVLSSQCEPIPGK